MAKQVKSGKVKKTVSKKRASQSVIGASWGGISSEAVAKATGRVWEEWCRVLDKDKCASKPHKEIAELVHDKHGVGDWWSQMVTVGYEQARGLRQKHQKADGFSVSASRVFEAPMARTFRAVKNGRERVKWLDAAVTVTKATPGKSVRMKWEDGTRVAVNFWDKSTSGARKTQVVFQHEKLKNAAAAKKMKSFWTSRLDDLGALLSAR
jgi:uncharacterized protein YndB with AHSA1/START domain